MGPFLSWHQIDSDTPTRLASSRAQPFLTALNNQSSALAHNGLKSRRPDPSLSIIPKPL